MSDPAKDMLPGFPQANSSEISRLTLQEPVPVHAGAER